MGEQSPVVRLEHLKRKQGSSYQKCGACTTKAGSYRMWILETPDIHVCKACGTRMVEAYNATLEEGHRWKL